MIHIVLYEPEIPQNTGNIIRTCAATGAMLHLIEPLGFIFDEKRVRRSAMDYGDQVEIRRYVDWQSFLKTVDGSLFFLTRYGQKTHSDFDFTNMEKDIYLVFGKESTGIPKAILREHFATAFRIPMVPKVRSLNLANTVAIVTYEVLRQVGYPNLAPMEILKGKDFIFHDEDASKD